VASIGARAPRELPVETDFAFLRKPPARARRANGHAAVAE